MFVLRIWVAVMEGVGSRPLQAACVESESKSRMQQGAHNVGATALTPLALGETLQR